MEDDAPDLGQTVTPATSRLSTRQSQTRSPPHQDDTATVLSDLGPDPSARSEGGQTERTVTSDKRDPTQPILDLQIGVWRGHWESDYTCIIGVGSNLLVRYLPPKKRLDMVFYDTAQREFVRASESSLAELDINGISSLHHFSVRRESYILTMAEDRQRFAVVAITPQRKFEHISRGKLPLEASHVVMFQYRGMHYALAYSSVTGEYAVIAMPPLLAGQIGSAIVSRGAFKPGWTDVIWKGTHHVRCTRQRFFCYNASSGEVAFECVWVRGASTSSSIVSQEHRTMPAEANDNPLNATLKKKNCTAVPIQLGGRLACLLYSHSNLPKRDIQQSTGKLLGATYGAGAITNVAESASILLQKKIFAHSDPWTHFCVLGDEENVKMGVGGSGDHLISYSSISGEIWVSRAFHSSAPIKEVTVLPDRDEIPEVGPETTSPRSRGRGGLTKAALGNVEHGRVDVEHFARSQPIRSNSVAHSHAGRGVDHHNHRRSHRFSSARSPELSSGGAHSPGSGGSPTNGNRRMTHSARSDRPSMPLHPRPPTAGMSLRERLSTVATTDDYNDDIAKVIEQLRCMDYIQGDSPSIKMALENVDEMEPDETLEKMFTADGKFKKQKKGAIKEPWRDVTGAKTILPLPFGHWLIKHEKDRDKYRAEEIPGFEFTHKQMMRLHKPPWTREQFVEKKMKEAAKDMAKKQVDYTGDPHNPLPEKDGHKVARVTKKLGEDDLRSRHNKMQGVIKKHGFKPPEPKIVNMTPEKLGEKMSDDVLRSKANKMKSLKRKLFKPLEGTIPVKKVTKEEEKEIALKHMDHALEARAKKHDRILKEQTVDKDPPRVVHSPEHVRDVADRLYHGEHAEERAAA